MFSAHSCDDNSFIIRRLEGFCDAQVFGFSHKHKEDWDWARANRADCVICSVRAQRDAERAGQGAAVQNGGVLRECMLEKFKGRFYNSVNRKYQHSVHIELSREQRMSRSKPMWKNKRIWLKWSKSFHTPVFTKKKKCTHTNISPRRYWNRSIR